MASAEWRLGLLSPPKMPSFLLHGLVYHNILLLSLYLVQEKSKSVELAWSNMTTEFVGMVISARFPRQRKVQEKVPAFTQKAMVISAENSHTCVIRLVYLKGIIRVIDEAGP